MQLFLTELKNSNNNYRLLSEKLGQPVYKIPDELWARNYALFSAELAPNVRLEAKPNGVTQEDVPVYMRTGKVI